jgi:hypothetical protein
MIRRALLTAISVTFVTASVAATHSGKQIQAIFPGDKTHDCVFVALQGVSQADPAVSQTPWLVLVPTHPRFKETYALLMAARFSGETVDIGTTGSTASGSCSDYPEINYVVIGQQPN